MNLFQIMPLFSACATLVVGVLSFLSHPKRRINQSFLILTVMVTLWQLSIFLGMSSTHTGPLMFWIRQASAFSAVVPSLVFMNRISILHSKASFAAILWKSKEWLLSAACIFVLCQSTWFLEGVSPIESGTFLPIPDYGNGFYVFCLYLIITFFTLIFLLVKDNQKLRGTEKTEIEYILLSCGTSFFLAVFFLIAPLILNWNDLGAFLPVSGIGFAAISGYGIATGSILDAPVVARRIVAYLVLVVYLSVLFVITNWIAMVLLANMGHDPAPLSYLLASFIVVFSASSARGFTQRLTNKLFINTPALDVGLVLREAGNTLNTALTVDELCTKFHSILKKYLETTELRILILEQESFQQIYPPNNQRSLPKASKLPSLLTNGNHLVVRDLIPRRKLTLESTEILTELKTEQAAAAVSMQRDNRQMGFMLLGPRESGRIYAHEEAMAVEGLRDLFAFSYENARLYTELQNNQLYMDLLLTNMVNGVVATDADGIITTCNPEAAKILDHQAEDLVSKPYYRIPAPLGGILKKVFDQDLVVRDRQVTYETDKNDKRYLNIGASLFRDMEGNVIGSLMVLQDRTAIHNLEVQVKRSERLASLGTLSAGMAHEIKNPLVTLKTFTQLLPERFHDEDYRDTFVDLAGKEINRIDGLVDKLLSLARPVKLDLEPIDLNALLTKYAKGFRQQAEDGGVNVLESYKAKDSLIAGDPDQLKQVLLNLLLNAQQAMPEGGTLTIHTQNVSGHIELRISDTGVGISQEDQEHIFDPFFTTKSGGTGLGLAVAHQILQEHNALVRIESIPTAGCSFIILFPLADDDGGSR